MVLRYCYLLRSSWPRLLELIYWPAVQMLMWGFLQLYIAGNAGFFARAGGTFIGAVLLWDILFRGQLGFSISFLEEMWARNLANLMISPLRPIEFIMALMVMSVVRLAIGMVPVSLIAIAFFGFNIYGLGLALAAFFMNLILTSWSVGLVVSGLVMRNGMGAESLAWTMMFLIMPVNLSTAVTLVWFQKRAKKFMPRRTEGVDDRHAAPGKSFLKVLGKKQTAACVSRRRNNRRIPDSQPVVARQTGCRHYDLSRRVGDCKRIAPAQ